MSKRNVPVYRCDFCGSKVEHFLPRTWFNVYGVLGMDDGKHACKKCGHEIHTTLNKLGIDHSFCCNEYASVTSGPGYIMYLASTRADLKEHECGN